MSNSTTAIAPTAPHRIKIDPIEAILVKGKHGTFRQIRTAAKLSTLDGTLVRFGGGKQEDDGEQNQPAAKKNTYIISATGFTVLRGLCGVTVLHPATLTIDDRVQPNPYIDDRTGKVHCRAVAIGYTQLGQLAISDRTVVYDFAVANLQDLIAKAASKWGKGKFQAWPRKVDANGQLITPTGLSERWAAYPLDEAMVMWVDTSASDVWKWQREMTNRKSKAERTCQTFADRNAVAAHPALPSNRKFEHPTISLPCVSWFAESGNLRFDQSLLQIDASKLMEAEPTASVSTGVDNLNQQEDVVNLEKSEGTVDPNDSASEDEDEEEPENKDGAATATDKPKEALPLESAEEIQNAIKVLEQRIGVRMPIKRARDAVKVAEKADVATVTDMKILEEWRKLLQAALE